MRKKISAIVKFLSDPVVIAGANWTNNKVTIYE